MTPEYSIVVQEGCLQSREFWCHCHLPCEAIEFAIEFATMPESTRRIRVVAQPP
jgi:hypothetical protein